VTEAAKRPGAAEDSEAAAEVRTFLIADVRGYTHFTLQHGDEAAARLAARFAELAQDVVTTRDGNVIELRGDEALAVFLSPRQALRAAVELQRRFLQESTADLPLNVGIGLDAGEAIPVAGGYRGAALNLAARLCSLAGPGEVLASDTVANLARKLPGVEYAERGLVELKGFADKVHVVQVLPEAHRGEPAEDRAPGGETALELIQQHLLIGGFLGSLPSGPLVGRNEELRELLASIEAAGRGEGKLVLLAGEPGVGKTRLAQEATLVLRNQGFLIAAGRCYEPRQTVPFYPFLDALATLYADGPGALRSQLPRRWPYLARLLPDRDLSVPATSSDGMEEQERLFRAVTGFIQAIAGAIPVALLLDDLHWADSASLELLQHLTRHTRGDRVFLLGTYRDVEVGRQHPLEGALRDLTRERLVEDVPIRRLAQEGTAALTAATFGQQEISAEFAALLQRHTEGNPFFVQEVLRALVERGDIYRENGRWERREIEELEVPKSVRSAIGERLSRLGEEAQDVLYEASVLGQSFAFDDLQAVSDRAERAVEQALDEAMEAGLIRETGRDAYAFNHALTQQALYAELSGRRRRRLHLAAGEALEKRAARAMAPRAAELAWHFLEGDDPQRALPYALLAGDQAEAVFAHEEAERQYRAALELAREVSDQPREAEATEKLGVVLRTTGRYDEALELLERAAQQYSVSGDLPGESRTIAQIGRVHARKETTQEGITRLQAAIDGIEGTEDRESLAELHVVLAYLFFVTGRYSEMLAAAERASELATAVGNNKILAEAELRRGTALAKLGHPVQGAGVLEELIPLSEAAGDLDTLARVLNNVGFWYYLGGDFSRSRAYRLRMLEVARAQGDPNTLAFALTMFCQELYGSGEWSEARAYAEQAVDLARSIGPAYSLTYALGWRGWMHTVQGEWEAAAEDLQQGLRMAETSGDMQALGMVHTFLAELDLLQGRPEQALAWLDPLIGRAGIAEEDKGWILPRLAWAHLELGHERAAEEAIEDAVNRTRAGADRWDLVDALRIQGMLRARQERWDEAVEAFEEVVSLARGMPCPFAEARALYEYGMMRIRKGELQQAQERLKQALVLFQRLGASPYIERTEHALAGGNRRNSAPTNAP